MKTDTIKQELEEQFTDFARRDIEEALILVTGLFVGLHIAFCDIRGNEGDGQKKIDIEGHRNITIHAAEP